MNTTSGLKPTAAVAAALIAAAIVAGPAAAGSEPPDSRLNPQTGWIEIADPAWSDGQYDVHHVTNTGDGRPSVDVLTDHPADDLQPRIEIDAAGNTWVTWWRDAEANRVIVRKRDFAGGAWSAERFVSAPGEDGRNPAIVFDGTKARIAYEVHGGGNTAIAVGVINDEPDPISCQPVATSGKTGRVEVLIHAAAGAVWVTWIDGADQLGWSVHEPVSDTWSLPAYEPYPDGDVAAARARIRSQVTGE